jgi:peptide/nickel transport system permease protein
MIDDAGSTIKSRSRMSELRRTFNILFGRAINIAAAIILLIFILLVVFAPVISPYNPNAQNMNAILEQPSSTHLLGTDDLGRDELSRIIYGSRISLLVGVVSVFIAGVVGITLGLIAGYFGGWSNTIIMRFMDAILALPPLVLVLGIAALLGGGLFNIMLAIGIGVIPTYSRLMCGQVLTIKEADYIAASRTLGAGDFSIMFKHVLPNTFPPLLVLITMNLGTSILMEASLSFIGVGISAPTATWGAMVSNGYRYLLTNPINALVPGVAILLVVLAFNILGDGLRDAFDPRLRGLI